MENLKLFDAEYRFMNVLWEHEPVNSTELVRLCLDRFEWKKSTTYSMIKRLSERSVLKNENAIVMALVKKEDVQKYESEVLLEKTFDNSLPVFLTAFLRDKKLSKSESEKLKKMIEEATK
ncbi:MAG TPA: BlaI/MecI/CopY family transcriptional regulator [Ruminiclostridium sp.]|jgi:predicted transcriptional regulator|nr:BlaI/MecI/CopY family transcriptional regulator [Ruminiclostridium sp.]